MQQDNPEGWRNARRQRNTVAMMDDLPEQPGVFETSANPFDKRVERGFQYWDGEKFRPIRRTPAEAMDAPPVQSFSFPRPFWRPVPA